MGTEETKSRDNTYCSDGEGCGVREEAVRLAMRGCAGVFIASESRLMARGVLESLPCNFTFLFGTGEPDWCSSTLTLLGMFSLLGEALLPSSGSSLMMADSDVLAEEAKMASMLSLPSEHFPLCFLPSGCSSETCDDRACIVHAAPCISFLCAANGDPDL